MSDAFYTTIRDGTAASLLSQYGTPMSLRRETPGTYNPTTGQVAAGSTTDYVCYGVIDNYTLRDLQNSVIQTGDKRIYMTAGATIPEPKPGDTVVMGSTSWTVIDCVSLAPGGVAVLYTLQVRR